MPVQSMPMVAGMVRWGLVLAVICTTAGAARAQSTRPPGRSEPGRFEVSAGAGWWSGYDLGTSRAERPAASGGGILYDADASISGGVGAAGRVAWRVWRRLSVEGAVAYSRVRLRSSVRSDVEPALNAALETSFNQLAVEAGAVAPMPRAAFAGGRLVPFVAAGGGYFRQLYEGGVLLETGRLVYGGGGVRLALGDPRPERFLKRMGLRADARIVVRTGGIDVAERTRAFVTLVGGAFVRF